PVEACRSGSVNGADAELDDVTDRGGRRDQPAALPGVPLERTPPIGAVRVTPERGDPCPVLDVARPPRLEVGCLEEVAGGVPEHELGGAHRPPPAVRSTAPSAASLAGGWSRNAT